jgi:hypothetical protein
MNNEKNNNKDKYILNGEKAKLELISEVVRLDRLVYPEKYQTIPENAMEWYLKNRDIFVFLFEGKTLIGYICILPISDNLYDEIRSGSVIQDVLIPKEEVLEYKKGTTYNLYIFSVVLDPAYHGSDAVRYLIKGMADNLNGLEMKGISFNRVLADAVSEKGEKLVSSLGLRKIHSSNHNSGIYEATFNEMMMRINSRI